MRIHTRRAIHSVLMALLLLCANLPVAAQQPVTTRYIYDQNGRLRAVITPEGAAVYDYDPAGNFTAIRRLSVNACEALEFSPRQGAPGTTVTIYGVGFNTQVSRVTFNGAIATITAQTATSVTVKVPDGAMTGPLAISAPCGTRTFAAPFTVSGVVVLPPTIAVSPGRTVQFTANVAGVSDPTVTWSVEGNGTITDTGLYTAPPSVSGNATAIFTVRATVAAETSIFGEAMVRVTPSGYEIVASGVAVRYGTPANNAVAYVASPIAVRYGDPPKNGPAYVAGPVAVRYGAPSSNGPVYVAGPVSARYGQTPTIAPTSVITSVSVTRGASVLAVSTRALTPGETAVITLTGVNLTEVTALRFVNEDGAEETTIIASNIKVKADGTLLTAKLTVKREAKPGRRSLRIITAAGTLPLNDGARGSIEIVPSI